MATLFSLLPKLTKLVSLSPTEELVTEALAASGYLPSMMITLCVPLGKGKGYYYDESWFCAAIGLLMRAYYKKYGVMLEYQIVMNRGYSGTGNVSAHVVWKDSLPAHTAFLADWWNAKYGVDRASVSAHTQCLRYFVKNMSQPSALTHDGPHNRVAAPTKKRARHAGRS